MGISCVSFEAPLSCNRSLVEQKSVSCVRITVFAIGIICLLIGFLSCCEGFGNSAGVEPNLTSGLLGIFLIMGSSLHCKTGRQTPSTSYVDRMRVLLFSRPQPTLNTPFFENPSSSAPYSNVSDSDKDNNFGVKAKEYAEGGQLDEALEMVKQITHDTSNKEAWLAYLGQCYHNINDKKHVCEIIMLVASNAIANKLVEKGLNSHLQLFVTSEKTEKTHPFLTELADEIYPDVCKHFAISQGGLAIQCIILKAHEKSQKLLDNLSP